MIKRRSLGITKGINGKTGKFLRNQETLRGFPDQRHGSNRKAAAGIARPIERVTKERKVEPIGLQHLSRVTEILEA